MARQQYETEHDLMNERVAISAFLEYFETNKGIDYFGYKMPKSMNLDYLIVKQDKVKQFAVVEIKRRRHKFGEFPDLMISAIKWNIGIAYHELGFKFFILIKYDDGYYWYCYDPQHTITIKEGGRTIQKRDEWDEEECAHIPNAYWKPIIKNGG